MPALGQACEGVDETVTAENSYDVFRNGSKIGEHIISFNKSGEKLSVTSKTFMQVKLLFISAFKYEYDSAEQWCGNNFQSVVTNTNNNGKDILTVGVVQGDKFNVTVTTKKDEVKNTLTAPLVPTNHWNKIVLEQGGLFDTIKGNMFDIAVTPNTDELHPGFTGQRFDVAGEYEYSTYYDENGHWLGMAFYRDKKNFIEFRCRDCKNTLLPNGG